MKKKFLALVLTLAMVLSLVPVTALAAGTTQSNIQNPNPVRSTDGFVKLEKTAAAVEESDNTFDITLKATVEDGKQEGTKTSTDAVLVIDRSASMEDGRINSAQEAAKQFAEVVLGSGANKENRIAVVSYAKKATTDTELSSNLETVKNAINFNTGGGTNIQAGIKAARDILQSSSADHKVILVLSDGAPTYSFRAVGTATQTGCWIGEYTGKHRTRNAEINPTSVNITGFDYNSIAGSGSDYSYTWYERDSAKLQVTCKHNETESKNYLFYDNNGEPTIKEASYAKEADCEIYSIYLGKSTDTNAVSTMKEIATDNDHYKLATEASELGKLFKGIAKDITLPVVPGTVTDPMGEHMNLVASSLKDQNGVTIAKNGKQFTWDLTQVTPADNADGSRTYELKYQITFDTDFTEFDATKFYPTNQETTLSYTVNGKQETAKFPIPKVKGTATTYQLTYHANGGNEGSVPTDSTPYTRGAKANLNYDTKPTHDPENEKNVIFIGWSETPDTTIYDKGSTIDTSSLIQSVTMNGDKNVYAVWGYDAIGENDEPDGVPDVFNAVVTYKIVGGTWDGTNDSATEFIKVKEFNQETKEWTDTNNKLVNIPDTTKVTPDANHTSSGSWGNSDSTPTKDTVVDADMIYTYTLEAAPSAPTYTLTYNANGGKADLVPTDSTTYTAGQTANLKYNPQPTHDQENGKDVIFIGWSETNDSGKIYNKGNMIPDLIQSVKMDGNKTVYAVWGLDEDGNGIPDVFEATVTYKIEHGYWFNAGTDGPVSTAPVTAQFTLYEKSGNQWVAKNPTLGNTIPTGRGGDQGYTADGWYKDSEKTDISKTTPVTGDVTYTFKYVKTSTEATWDVSRSKTAASGLTKNSNGDWTTDVTLSLPSAEEELASDVVFVLDTSDCVGTVMDQVSGLVTQLKAAQNSSGANIKVGVVAFKGSALPMFDGKLVSVEEAEKTLTQMIGEIKAVPEKNGKPDKAAQEQVVMKYINKNDDFIYKGSNLHSGLLGAQELLKKDTDVSNTRKYVVTVTDGMTYYWNKGDDVYGVYGGSNADNTAEANLLFYTWCGVHGIDTEGTYKFPGTFSWDTYVTSAKALIAADNGAYDVNIREAAKKLGKDFSTVRFIDNADLPAQSIPYISYNDRVNHAHGIDQSVIACLATYQEMVDSKYKCYVVNSDYDTSTFPGLFTSELNKLANVTGNVDFTSIQKDILYAVSAGSIVTDTIGEKFTFGGVNSVTLTVGGNKITGTVDGNTVNFGEKKSDGKYPYTVTYTPDTKTFVWTINENVSNFAPVQLTYTVKLTKPETAAATYGQTDLDGDTFIDGTQTKVDTGKALYTNQSATLLPVNSAGKLGQPLLFPKPSVFYTIKGSSGGHSGGGTVTIPDDVPTGLNGKDHYAYVVGYPDGMVYPQKNITRAEVATIFFRLLKDETREANMTKSNSYNDMKDGAWYTCAVSTLSKMGIIKGYEDGSFKPDASISRAEFAAIAARFDPDGDKTPATFSDVSSHWAKDEISIAANHGWIKGYEDGSFKPDQKITRAETMTLVNRVLKRLPETKDDLHKDMKTWPDNQNESAWFYLAVQEATNSHYQKLKKDGIHEKWESMRETRDWAALEK